MKTWIGIDPGKDGGICILQENFIECLEMPVNCIDEIKSSFIYYLIKEYKQNCFCLIEKSQSMPGQNSVSVFNYGKGYGQIISILQILKIPYEEISPLKWKREFNLIYKKKKGEKITIYQKKKIVKERAVTIAEKLQPCMEFKTEKGILLDGKAESFLLAEYARRKNL